MLGAQGRWKSLAYERLTAIHGGISVISFWKFFRSMPGRPQRSMPRNPLVFFAVGSEVPRSAPG